MRRKALHAFAALPCFALGLLAADAYEALAYASFLLLTAALAAKAVARFEFEMEFLAVAFAALLFWGTGAYAFVSYFTNQPYASCVIDMDDATETGTETGVPDTGEDAEPPAGLTVYTCDGALGAQPRALSPLWVGVVDRKAVFKPAPVLTPLAKLAGIHSAVAVSVLIDESGKVLTAQAVAGHPLYRQSAMEAACRTRFSPTPIDGPPFGMSGVLTYEFTP